MHGPHDHKLARAQQGGQGGGHGASGGMITQIGLFTAIVFTVGTLSGYMGGTTQANAGIYKNNAAIQKTEASNQWHYFQSKNYQTGVGRSGERPGSSRSEGVFPGQEGAL